MHNETLANEDVNSGPPEEVSAPTEEPQAVVAATHYDPAATVAAMAPSEAAAAPDVGTQTPSDEEPQEYVAVSAEQPSQELISDSDLKKHEKTFVAQLERCGLNKRQLGLAIALRDLVRVSYKDMLQHTSGGIYRVFCDVMAERESASKLLVDAMAALQKENHKKRRAEDKVILAERRFRMEEVERLSRVVGRCDEALAKIHHTMQNSIFALAKQYQKAREQQDRRPRAKDWSRKPGYVSEIDVASIPPEGNATEEPAN